MYVVILDFYKLDKDRYFLKIGHSVTSKSVLSCLLWVNLAIIDDVFHPVTLFVTPTIHLCANCLIVNEIQIHRNKAHEYRRGSGSSPD